MNINFRDDICKTVALSPFFSFFYSDFSWFFHFFVQLQKFFKNHSLEIHRISWARWNRNFILFKNHRNEVLTQINGLAARADFLPRGRFFSKKSDFVNYFFSFFCEIRHFENTVGKPFKFSIKVYQTKKVNL